MQKAYSIDGNATNTVSTTVPLVDLVQPASPSTRALVYELNIGSDATPANSATKYLIVRGTARGTASTSLTANPFDPTDPAASTLADNSWSVNPTLAVTTNGANILWQIGLNQQATYRWVAVPGFEMVLGIAAGALLALMSAVNNGGTYNCVFNFNFRE